MEVVTLSNRQYKKAAVAAKEWGYTSDYVGQLCRAGKLDAQRIGGSWFVNSDSIEAHKKQKYQNATDKQQYVKEDQTKLDPKKTVSKQSDASRNRKQANERNTGDNRLIEKKINQLDTTSTLTHKSRSDEINFTGNQQLNNGWYARENYKYSSDNSDLIPITQPDLPEERTLETSAVYEVPIEIRESHQRFEVPFKTASTFNVSEDITSPDSNSNVDHSYSSIPVNATLNSVQQKTANRATVTIHQHAPTKHIGNDTKTVYAKAHYTESAPRRSSKAQRTHSRHQRSGSDKPLQASFTPQSVQSHRAVTLPLIPVVVAVTCFVALLLSAVDVRITTNGNEMSQSIFFNTASLPHISQFSAW